MILSIVSLTGAILMFRLKRIGFCFYTAAQVLMLVVTPLFIGFSWVAMAGVIFSGILALIFIIMYALNLKYMR